MSEVQKYVAIGGMMPVDSGYGLGVFVQSNDYDAAQSQLAALREELAQTKRTAITEILALNSTLREQAKSLAAMSDRELEISAEHADDLQQRLADAERRYSGLRKLTPYRFKKIQDASVTDGGDVLYFHADRFDALLDAALNPNPEAASHDE